MSRNFLHLPLYMLVDVLDELALLDNRLIYVLNTASTKFNNIINNEYFGGKYQISINHVKTWIWIKKQKYFAPESKIFKYDEYEKLNALGFKHMKDILLLENIPSVIKILQLSDGKIEDLSPLKNLTSLTHLSLKNNKIKDVSSLKNLTSLVTLSLSDNKIKDVLPLKNLTSLIKLDLSYNRIEDISPLRNFILLEKLWLQGNNIKYISPILNLTSLKKMWTYNNNIRDEKILVLFNCIVINE